MVVDELWDGVEIMLLCQVKLALLGGADVIMSAASTSFPVERVVKSNIYLEDRFRSAQEPIMYA